ncbi:hypothetical protein Tco_1285587 [Tanacetum coccineum]
MVAYLEKTDGNAEFHEIIDFLTRSSIHYALTVSLVVSTTFVEQFWMTAKSKTINNVRYITATVAGKPVSISEASIRSDLQFNDAAGIDVLSNQAIFDTIQLMGYEVEEILHTLTFSKKNPRNVTPLFPSMLAQPIENEGVVSKRPSETQPTPSFSHPSEDPIEPQPDPSLRPSSSNPIPDSILEGSGGNHGAAQIKDLKSQIKQLKKKAKPVISHHHAWIKSVSMKKRLARKKSLMKHLAFDDFDDIVDDAMDYMETEDAQDEGRTSSKTLELSLSGDTMVLEEKESAEKGVSTKDPVSTAQPKVSTDKPKVSTDKPKVSTDKDDEGTVEPKDGNSDESATPTMTLLHNIISSP